MSPEYLPNNPASQAGVDVEAQAGKIPMRYDSERDMYVPGKVENEGSIINFNPNITQNQQIGNVGSSERRSIPVVTAEEEQEQDLQETKKTKETEEQQEEQQPKKEQADPTAELLKRVDALLDRVDKMLKVMESQAGMLAKVIEQNRLIREENEQLRAKLENQNKPPKRESEPNNQDSEPQLPEEPSVEPTEQQPPENQQPPEEALPNDEEQPNEEEQQKEQQEQQEQEQEQEEEQQEEWPEPTEEPEEEPIEPTEIVEPPEEDEEAEDEDEELNLFRRIWNRIREGYIFGTYHYVTGEEITPEEQGERRRSRLLKRALGAALLLALGYGVYRGIDALGGHHHAVTENLPPSPGGGHHHAVTENLPPSLGGGGSKEHLTTHMEMLSNHRGNWHDTIWEHVLRRGGSQNIRENVQKVLEMNREAIMRYAQPGEDLWQAAHHLPEHFRFVMPNSFK